MQNYPALGGLLPNVRHADTYRSDSELYSFLLFSIDPAAPLPPTNQALSG